MSLIQPPRSDDASPSYRYKPKPVGFELVYRLEGDELVIDSTRRIDRIKLATVEQVRFVFKPANLAATGYVTTIRLKDGKTITIGDTSWRSLIEVERGGARYVGFITALSAAIARLSPQARFVGGRPPAIWGLFAAVSAVTVMMLVLFIVQAIRSEAGGVIWIGVLLFAIAVWQMLPMVRLNRPIALRTGEVPAHLMPVPEKVV